MFELVILARDGRPLRRAEVFHDRPTTIGRARECDVQLAAATISRRHARIIPLDDGLCYQDLGSTHGSFVNGRRVREIALSPGLEVQLGPAKLRFESIAARIGAEIDADLADDEDSIIGNADSAGALDDTIL